MSITIAEQGKKHIPWIEIIETKIIIKIWYIVEHPMMKQHYISLIDILKLTTSGYVSVIKKILSPDDKPKIELELETFEKWTYRIQAHCNIHWVWENEILI